MIENIYCSAPWKGITIREDGAVRTCCVGGTELGNLRHQSIKSIMSSDKLAEIKQNLLDNKHDKNCDSCQKNERIGNTSLRQHYQKHYPLRSPEDFQLKFIDVRWNNHCNLACVYCSPEFSSEWAKIKNIPILSAKKSYQNELLEWMLEKSHDLEEVLLVGGEPLLMKQNHQLIETLPDNCRLSIITNLSYDLSKISCLETLLNRPREMTNWNISAENIESQFEYIRNGADWNQFLENIDFVVEHWPDNITLLMVYGIFSALSIDETIKFFHSRGIKKFVFQSLFKHSQLNVMAMPDQLRSLCLASLENTKVWHQETFGIDAELYPIDGLDTLIDQLKTHSSAQVTPKDFAEKIKEFDFHTKTRKFRDLWPDIQPYIDGVD
jgi:radical SAM protein with 4Fe4S-binding SPASM domain